MKRAIEQLLNQKQSIDLNMLRKNLALESIAEVIGLTISELEGFANAQFQELQAQVK